MGSGLSSRPEEGIRPGRLQLQPAERLPRAASSEAAAVAAALERSDVTRAQGIAMAELLVASKVTKRFGGLVAVNAVDFVIEPQSIVSLIGPNGAGKTTFFNMLAGLYTPTSGTIVFQGQSIAGRKAHTITRMGIARTFQNIRLFGTMSALENVLVGQHSRMKAGLVGSVLRTPRTRREEKAVREKARETLAYVGLRPSSWTSNARVGAGTCADDARDCTARSPAASGSAGCWTGGDTGTSVAHGAAIQIKPSPWASHATYLNVSSWRTASSC